MLSSLKYFARLATIAELNQPNSGAVFTFNSKFSQAFWQHYVFDHLHIQGRV